MKKLKHLINKQSLKCKRLYKDVLILILLVVCVCLCLMIIKLKKENNLQKNECNELKEKLCEYCTDSTDKRALQSWENTIEKLSLDVDIAFFGDSITMHSNFQECFRDKKIINLGYGSEGIVSMCDRYSVINKVQAEKVFIMGGINYFEEVGPQKTCMYMLELINLISNENPNSEIYIQSILPVSKEKEEQLGIKNVDIMECNQMLKDLQRDNRYIFVDLYSLYEKDGYLNSHYTYEGVHITDYSLWEKEIEKYVYN